MDRNYKRAPSIQALDPLSTHLDDTAKVPNFKHCTSDAQDPPPPTPGHVSPGPSYLADRYLKDNQKTRYMTYASKTNTLIVQALDPPPTHLDSSVDNTVKVPSFKHCTSNAQGPPLPPWTCKFRSYLLPSYSTDIWKMIKRLDIWHTSRLKTNTSIIHTLDPPPILLDDRQGT